MPRKQTAELTVNFANDEIGSRYTVDDHGFKNVAVEVSAAGRGRGSQHILPRAVTKVRVAILFPCFLSFLMYYILERLG